MSFHGFNSLDALRISIASRLGLSSGARGSQEDYTPMIGQLLIDEARNNERRVGAFRALMSLAYLALALAARLLGNDPTSTPIVIAAALWSAASAALYFALREGWYPPRLRRVIPVGDALALVIGAALVERRSEQLAETHAALAGNISILCACLVFTGALRLTPIGTFISSALAILSFVAVAFVAHLRPLPVVGIVTGLIGLSLLASGVTEAIRRVITTEVRRLKAARLVERANARTAEAQSASKAREEVLRIVAHDLRNPLGTLLMASDLLAEPSMSQELRSKQADVIKRTGARMNRLIQDLLNVARMDTGTMSIDARPIDPAQLVASAIELMRPLAIEKTLTLDAEPAQGLPEVNADAERIGQVFSNLIGNAIKFTPAGGRITLRAEGADGTVWFSVVDTGPGIPPEQVDKVFAEFWQARRTDSRGIGLGLTIAKGIIEAHGGKIGVHSEVGVGTRFWFGLSCANAGDRAGAAEAVSEEQPLRQRRVSPRVE